MGNTKQQVEKIGSSIQYIKEGRTAHIVLYRMARRNALSMDMIEALRVAFERAKADDSTKVIRLSAQGSVFCSGADLDDLERSQSHTFEESMVETKQLASLFYLIYTCPKAVVAQVEGPALAGGCGLVALCDFVFATPSAYFGCPEVRIGFVPALIMYFLQKRIGMTHTKWLTLTGSPLPAQQALQVGLVNQVVDNEAINKEVSAFIDKLITKNAFASMQLTKTMLNYMQDSPLSKVIDYAAEMNVGMRASEDCKRGVKAFLNKQKISWENDIPKPKLKSST